ncbi:MAG TPA: alpha-L-fucosidase [Lentisphaeria bacterium]|nr:MAG: alpha-L-fucosidase [Lentisphaerae bacterium GWF2_50_93]HCE43238.1 alpha-L-fucosidase [Lentisphaeria bacterium]
MECIKDNPIAEGPFTPAWESLRNYKCPEWFRDAKFGIWSHWGPQSVPMYGDWYARHMYVEGQPQYLHHWRNYGHPSKHGWKDMVKLWKAERFNPEGLMKLYEDAGAKYFVAQAMHHDNFDNWNSKHHAWNAVKTGPKKDIVKLWHDAARKRGLRFGVTEHLGASYTWFESSKHCDKTGPYAGVPYDGASHDYDDLYHPNRTEPLSSDKGWQWYTENKEFHEKWFLRIKDLVDQFQPDLLYSDGGLPFLHEVKYDLPSRQTTIGANRPDVGLNIVAHLYNISAKLHDGKNEAVYNQKDLRPEIAAIGVLDIERGQMNEAKPYVWQTDTCVGGWFYDVRQVYKTPQHVIEMLVDIVSKNGNLLLNFPQRPDGTLDEENLNILRKLADWTKINGEGIYGTRPWITAGEGPTQVLSQHSSFKEDAVPWTTSDFRFTLRQGSGQAGKKNCIYAFQMKYPERREAFIRSLGMGFGKKITSVRQLGHDGELSFRQLEDGLLVQLPERQVCENTPCLKITSK